jgi:hypothetical protein
MPQLSLSTLNSKTRTALICLGVASLIVGFSAVANYAEDPKSGSLGTPSNPIQGGVVKIDVTLNDLRDARLSTSRVRKAAANLYDEVTRQQVTMNYNPNVVGMAVIMTPSPSFTGAYLPPRKKWVEAAMSEIGPIITLLKEDVDLAIESNRRTEVADATRAQLDPLRDEAFSKVNTSFDLYKQLQKLCFGVSSYDNQAIAHVASSLDHEMKSLDKSLKKGIAVLQKEAKASKKTKSVATVQRDI